MKKILKILNSLVVLTISSTAVIACGEEDFTSNHDIIEEFRNRLVDLENLKKNTDDNDEIAKINQEIDEIVTKWVVLELGLSELHAYKFKIELKQPTSWKKILQEMIPNCLNEYFSSHPDLKNYFDISKLIIPLDQTPFYYSPVDRYVIKFMIKDQIGHSVMYMEIINRNLIED